MTSHHLPPEGLPTDLPACTTCDGNGCEEGCGNCQSANLGPNSHRICRACDGTGRAPRPAFPDALRRVVQGVSMLLADEAAGTHLLEEHAEYVALDLRVLAEALAPDGIMADDLGGVWWGEPEAEGSHRVATIARHDGEQLTYRILMDMGWRLVTANDLETLLTLAYSAAGHADTLGLDMDLHDRVDVLYRIRETVLVQQAATPPWHVHDPSAEETARRVMASVGEIRKQVDHLLALARSSAPAAPTIPAGDDPVLIPRAALALVLGYAHSLMDATNLAVDHPDRVHLHLASLVAEGTLTTSPPVPGPDEVVVKRADLADALTAASAAELTIHGQVDRSHMERLRQAVES